MWLKTFSLIKCACAFPESPCVGLCLLLRNGGNDAICFEDMVLNDFFWMILMDLSALYLQHKNALFAGCRKWVFDSDCKITIYKKSSSYPLLYMPLNYGTSAILFALKILPFQHDLWLWSPNLFFPKITMRALLALARNFVTVLPLYCFLQILHSIKYTTILEL